MDKIKKLIKEALLNHKHDCGCGCHGKCAKAPMLNENLGAKVIMTENMQYHIDNKKALTENTFRYGSKAFLDLWAEARYLYSRDAINLSGEDKIIVETTHLGEYGLFEGEMVLLDLPIMEEMDEAISDEIKVGDIVGNTVQGFNFKVLNIKGDKLEVENTKTGKKFETYIDNMYLPVMEEVDEAISGADKDEIFALISKVKQQGKLSDDAQRVLMQWMSHPDASKEAIVKVLKQLTGTLNEAKDGKHVLNKPHRGGAGGKKYFVYVRNPKTKKIKKISFGDSGGLREKINDPKARKAFSARHDCPNKKDKMKASYWSCHLPRYAKALGLKSNFSGFW
jgi:hypothetical protein